jgi:hypothetical protein
VVEVLLGLLHVVPIFDDAPLPDGNVFVDDGALDVRLLPDAGGGRALDEAPLLHLVPAEVIGPHQHRVLQGRIGPHVRADAHDGLGHLTFLNETALRNE